MDFLNILKDFIFDCKLWIHECCTRDLVVDEEQRLLRARNAELTAHQQ